MPQSSNSATTGLRRAAIVASATEIFAEKGFNAASFREIAEAVGATKGNVTYYFAVKDDLLYEIVLGLHRSFVDLSNDCDRLTDPPEEVLRTAIRQHVMLVCRSAAATRVAYESFRALSPARRDEVVVLRDRYERRLVRIIGAASPQGTRPAEVALTTRLVLGAINWPYQWFRPEGQLLPEAIADRAARFVVDTVTPQT